MRFTLNTVVFAIASASLMASSVWAVPSRSGKNVGRFISPKAAPNPSRRSAPIFERDQGQGELASDFEDTIDAFSAMSNSTQFANRVLAEAVGIMKDIQANSQGDSLEITPNDNTLIQGIFDELSSAVSQMQGNASHLQSTVTSLTDELNKQGINPITPNSPDETD